MRKRMVVSVDKKRNKTNTCDQVSHEGSNENQQSKKRRCGPYSPYVPWQTRYGELVEFRINYGHTNVPQNYAKNMKLGKWVSNQRSRYKNDTLTKEGINQLNKLKFEWLPWQTRYGELVEFRINYGHTNVPKNYSKNMKLGKWVSTQRFRYKNDTLAKEGINQLNELKFEWSPRQNKRLSKKTAAQKLKESLPQPKRKNRKTAAQKLKESLPQPKRKNRKTAAQKLKESVRVNSICVSCQCLSLYFCYKLTFIKVVS